MLFGNALVQTPVPSPAAEFEQKVGLTDVEVECSRLRSFITNLIADVLTIHCYQKTFP